MQRLNDLEMLPGWPDHLTVVIQELGLPEEIYSISELKNRRRLIAGALLLVAAALGGLYIYVQQIENSILEIIACISMAIAGLSLVGVARSERGLWVLQYPHGLLRWQNNALISFNWDEVVCLQLTGVTHCGPFQGEADANGEPRSAWIPVDRSVSALVGPSMLLVRRDGGLAIFPSSLNNFATLVKVAQQQTFQRLWPKHLEQFRRKGKVELGEMTIRRRGVQSTTSEIDWNRIREVLICGGNFMIQDKNHHRPWGIVPLERILNPHVLMAFIAMGISPRTERPTATR
ncbi:MAG: DUF6585 family protein [Zavarzinella sp.]